MPLSPAVRKGSSFPSRMQTLKTPRLTLQAPDWSSCSGKGAWLASQSWHQFALQAPKGGEIFPITHSYCQTHTFSERLGTHPHGEFHCFNVIRDVSSRDCVLCILAMRQPRVGLHL